ncbi:MAG: Structural maintenance of chromosomes protein 5 [Paramarteilia canceri]
MQQKCLAYRREASTLSKIKDYSNIELPNELIDQLQLLPDSLKEIEEQIHLIIATNELSDGISNEKIFVHYQQEKEELASIEKRINSIEKEINEKKSSIESVKKNWLVKISEIISSVSQKYSKYLQHLGYAGEVLLDIPSNQDDFANYGIKIMVKYRDNEPLQKLDAMHQSGGERSVATVLYMLALQNLTTVPFRCIDEINQVNFMNIILIYSGYGSCK